MMAGPTLDWLRCPDGNLLVAAGRTSIAPIKQFVARKGQPLCENLQLHHFLYPVQQPWGMLPGASELQ